MEILREDAPAKVNLTLKVLGKRPDGFHEISSLAAFSGVYDRLYLMPGGVFSLKIEGPFAAALPGQDNLVGKAVSLFLQEFPQAQTGTVTLDKQLPVAAGLGGGSADAAAALRLLVRANPGLTEPESLKVMASRLGSDVAVCLESRAALMRGRGEEVSLLEGLPVLPVVLVNPGVELDTGEIYKALAAPPLDSKATAMETEWASFKTVADLAQYIASLGNDLQAPAMKIAPVIADMLAALAGTKGCLAAQMSGSGPTCFGIYPDRATASSAAAELAAGHVEWWIRETELS